MPTKRWFSFLQLQRFSSMVLLAIVDANHKFIAISSFMGRPTTDGIAKREKLKEYFNGDGAVHPQQNIFYSN